jgi:drug/metabolite transporter (DMT)-like permease
MIAERTKVWMAFTVVSTVWGSTWLAIKLGLQSVPPFLAAGVRFAIASFLLYVIIRLRGYPLPFGPVPRKIYAALGVLSFGIPFALSYWGQQFLPSALGSILFAAYPFWVALFQFFMLEGERPDVWKIAGIALGFAGVAVIFWGDALVADPRVLIGMLCIVISTILQAYVLLLIKREAQGINTVSMNFVGMLIGMVMLLGLSLAFESDRTVEWTATAIGSVAYLSVVGSVLTFVSYYWLLKRVDAVYLSLTSFINPIIAVLLGAAVLNERLEPAVYGGSILVLAGILLANAKAFYARLRPTA